MRSKARRTPGSCPRFAEKEIVVHDTRPDRTRCRRACRRPQGFRHCPASGRRDPADRGRFLSGPGRGDRQARRDDRRLEGRRLAVGRSFRGADLRLDRGAEPREPAGAQFQVHRHRVRDRLSFQHGPPGAHAALYAPRGAGGHFVAPDDRGGRLALPGFPGDRPLDGAGPTISPTGRWSMGRRRGTGTASTWRIRRSR